MLNIMIAVTDPQYYDDDAGSTTKGVNNIYVYIFKITK